MKAQHKNIFSLFSVVERRSRVAADDSAEIVGSLLFFVVLLFFTVWLNANHRQKFTLLISIAAFYRR